MFYGIFFLKIPDLIMEYGRPMQFVEDSKTSCNLLIKVDVFEGFLIIAMLYSHRNVSWMVSP